MTIDNLKNTLKELHAKLEASGNDDVEFKQLLQTLDNDIRHYQATEEAPPDSDFAAQAQSLSAKFAAQHPTLEPILRELTDILGRMGI